MVLIVLYNIVARPMDGANGPIQHCGRAMGGSNSPIQHCGRANGWF